MRTVKYLLPAMLMAGVFSSLSLAVTPDRIKGAIDPTNVVELKSHVTPMARPEFDQGPVEPSRGFHVSMLFLPTAPQRRQLEKLLAEQQDRTSPNFRKWLTPKQYGERFGLSHGDLEKIRAWLAAEGFKVTYVANGRDFLSFEGYAAQVESVFKTDMHYFNVNGKMHFANTRAPMIPAALAGIIGGFRGLHDFGPRPMHKPMPEYTESGLASHFLAPGDITTIYDINPLYKLSPAIDGTGQKIVIAGQSDVYLADLHNYRTAFGLSDITGCTMSTTTAGVIAAGTCSSGNFQMVVPGDGADPGLSAGDLGESDLDIEVISAVARKAEIIFVTSASSAGGVDDSAAWAIDQNPPLAPVISYSYGLCEAFVLAPNITTAESTYQKAAGEGISFFAAAGDAGAAECDGDAPPNGNYPAILGLSVSYPASSQYVTGVGGTEFNEGSGTYWNTSNTIPGDGASAKSYIPEIAWNDSVLASALDATGGGPSNCATGTGYAAEPGTGGYSFETCNAPPSGGFPKPTWQSGITPSDGVRDVPDIAFSASNANDPYIVCVPQSELPSGSGSTSTCANGIDKALTSFKYPSAFGGTSASTPLAAGMTVLLNQFLAVSGGLGSINKQLYTVIYKNNPSVFHDITSGSSAYGTSDNKVPCTGGNPTFEPSALQCPAAKGTTGSFGYSAGTGYDLVTGLGSLDVNAFFQAWQATEISFTTTATALSPATVSAGNSATSTVTINPQNSVSQSATYSFSCPGLPTGASCSFNPTTVTGSGSTTMTVATAPSMAPVSGAQVTVTGTSGGVSASASPLSLTVTATTQSFTLAAQNQTYQVTQGNSVTVTVNLTPANGFNAPVSYNCSEPATLTESTCTGPVGAISASTPASFLIKTSPATGKLQRPFERTGIVYAALLPGLLGIVFLFGSSHCSRNRIRSLGLIIVLGFSTVWLGSCSGSSSSNRNPGTPKGSYTITINATTGGAVPVSNSTTFTLQVQ